MWTGASHAIGCPDAFQAFEVHGLGVSKAPVLLEPVDPVRKRANSETIGALSAFLLCDKCT